MRYVTYVEVTCVSTTAQRSRDRKQTQTRCEFLIQGVASCYLNIDCGKVKLHLINPKASIIKTKQSLPSNKGDKVRSLKKHWLIPKEGKKRKRGPKNR